MSHRRLRFATAALALAGAGVAGYLVFERFAGGRIACTNGGCETVQHSSYAVVAGIPVALLGVVAYGLILILAFVRGEAAQAARLGVVLAGVVFSGYLLWAQAVPIGAFCVWCLASDAIMSVLAALALLEMLRVRFEPWTSSSSMRAPQA